jgi:D-alanyl-D-alanine carboxypeptidase (penicillin-binding protein 5/6)
VVLGGDRVTLDGGEIRTYSFYDTNLLFNWAFDNFSYKNVLSSQDIIQEVPVSLSKMDHVTVHPADDIEILLPNGLSVDDLERTVVLEADPVDAPVSAGQVLGTMELSYDGTVYATVDLLASFDVEASRLLTFWRHVQDFFSQTVVRVVLVILAVLLVVFLIWKLLFSRRRYRYGRSVGRGGSNYRGRRRR